MENRSKRLLSAALVLFLVSLAVRLIFGSLIVGLNAPPVGDSVSYDEIGTNLAFERTYLQHYSKGVWYSVRPPVLPFLLAAVYYIAGHSLAASRLLMIVIGSVVPLAVFALTRRIFGRRAALIAGAISALYPFFIMYSAFLLTEMPFTLLICLLIIFLLRFIDKRKTVDICLGGIMAGLGCLCRPILLAFMPLCIIWLLVFMRQDLSRFLRASILFILLAVVVIAPWTYRNYVVHGELVPITSLGGLTLWLGNNKWATGNLGDDYEMLVKLMPDPGTTKETEINRFFQAEARNYITTHPKRFLVLGVKKVFHLWRPAGFRIPGLTENTPESVRFLVGILSYVPLLFLFLLGFAMSIKQFWLFRSPGLLLLIFLILTFTVIHFIFPSVPRYRVPAEPAIIAIGSWALVRTRDLVKKRDNG